MSKLNADCLRLIFNKLHLDKKSLYSCLLVNREWCYLVVPILWKKYSIDLNYYDYTESETKLFNIILSCLPSSSKQLLFNNDIILPSVILSKPLLFNYVSFCKFLETDKITTMILKEFQKHDLLEEEIYKLFVNQCENIVELSWYTSQPLSLFPGASTCFSQLYDLDVNMEFVDSDALHELGQICKGLNRLSICNYCQDNPGLTSLIDAQKNLKRVSLTPIPYHNCKELSKSLARKGDTITDLVLGSTAIIPPSFLTSLANLKNIEIYNDHQYEEDIEEEELQQYLSISEFPKLQCINIEKLPCFKELAILIEKTKGNVSRINFSGIFNKVIENTGMLVKAIANNCPMITWLCTYLEPKDFTHVKSLLQNCRNLEYIRFNSSSICANENNDIGDELLDNLIKFSPKSLTKISISGHWKYSINTFQRFFESYKGRNLNYFEITPNSDHFTKDHKTIVIQYLIEGIVIDSNV